MKLKKIKNMLLAVLTFALVSVVAVAVTLAAVTGNMGNAENTFTNSPYIKLGIAETKWDHKDYDGNDKEGVEGDKGEDLALSYSTGMIIPKNPTLKNTSDSTDVTNQREWVAIKVEYKLVWDDSINVYSSKGEVGSSPAASMGEFTDTQATYKSYTDFSSAIAKVKTLQTDSDDTYKDGFNLSSVGNVSGGWSQYNGSVEALKNGTLFYYNTELDKNNETNPLFDAIEINSSFKTTEVITNYVSGEKVSCYEIKLGDGTTAYFEKLPKFEIKLTGYAIQAEGVDDGDTAIEQIISIYGLK